MKRQTWPYLTCKNTELINLQEERTATGSSTLHLGTSHSPLNVFSQISVQEDHNNSEVELAARHSQGTRKLDFLSLDNWKGFHPAPKLLPQSSLCEELTAPGVCSSLLSATVLKIRQLVLRAFSLSPWEGDSEISISRHLGLCLLLCLLTIVLKVLPEQSSLQVSE